MKKMEKAKKKANKVVFEILGKRTHCYSNKLIRRAEINKMLKNVWDTAHIINIEEVEIPNDDFLTRNIGFISDFDSSFFY